MFITLDSLITTLLYQQEDQHLGIVELCPYKMRGYYVYLVSVRVKSIKKNIAKRLKREYAVYIKTSCRCFVWADFFILIVTCQTYLNRYSDNNCKIFVHNLFVMCALYYYKIAKFNCLVPCIYFQFLRIINLTSNQR